VSTSPTRSRLDSVDLLRGVVMVIMALDHVRDFFSSARFDPTDLRLTSPELFFTRFITHFCAPVFVFLAGTGAFLSKKPKKDLARFLLTRGLWLVFLELTVVRFGWLFDVNYRFMIAQVIWAIGWSMVVLAGLVFLNVRVIALLGFLMVLLHNTLDGIKGGAGWTIAHVQAPIHLPGGRLFFVAYPLIPWIGVMALGYAFGELLQTDPERRRKRLLLLGGAMIVAFVILRATNLYGDPRNWLHQKDTLFTVLAFLNCEKYPPSLCYLLMTLGPAMLLLAAFEGVSSPAARPIIVFGRVPLFYYLVHLPVIHGAALVAGYFRHGKLLVGGPFDEMPKDYGYSLPIVYLVWAGAILILYPACAWFAGVKARRRDAWLSYL
jgi:uncharacterized membrane protein